MVKRILIVEDSRHVYGLYLRLQSPEVEVVVATNHDQAYERIEEGGWDLVLMDGSLEDGFDTGNLVRMLKDKGHLGPIIANSSNPGYTKCLVACGCMAPSNGDKIMPSELLNVIATL